MGCASSKPALAANPRVSFACPDMEEPSLLGGDLMGKARVLLQALCPLEGPGAASKAAEIILKHLGCGNVSIVAATPRPGLFIRLSGQGLFPRTHHRSQILLGANSSAAGLFKPARGCPLPAVVYRTVKSAEEAASLLPTDWEREYHDNGMRTFIAAPIIAHASEPMLGVLALSSFQPGAFCEPWWEPLLGIVAAGLVPMLQEPLTQGLVELAVNVLSTASVCDFVTAILQGTTHLLESIYNKSVSVRLGLVSGDRQSMLLLLPPPHMRSGDAIKADCSGLTLSCGSLSDDLRIQLLPTSNTLLLDALHTGQPCVVRNTAKFLEGSKEPFTDVFVDVDDVVCSIAAAPMLTTLKGHSKGCSSMGYGSGIADVGYGGSCDTGSSSSRSHSPFGSSAAASEARARKHTGHGSHGHRHQAGHAQQGDKGLGQKQQQQKLGAPPASPNSREACWYGCLYVAHQSPCDFQAEMQAITALSKMLTVLMMQCMPATMAWRELSEIRMAKHSAHHSARHSGSSTGSSTILSSAGSKMSCSGSPLTAHLGAPHSPTGPGPPDAAHCAAAAGVGGEAAGAFVPMRRASSLEAAGPSRLHTPGSGASPEAAYSAPTTIATGSIVETLRRQVLRSGDRGARKDRAYVEELQLQRRIGRGGFGTVYAGTWQGTPVAIKVMYNSQSERQLLKSAMEMAVMTTISHPNVVRVYACLTDLVEEAGPSFGPNALLSVRYRQLEGSEDKGKAPPGPCNIVVMELCDKGNLHQAMRHGLLHKRLPNKGLVVDMRLLNTVLLQIAHSLHHLHEHGVVHSDVKCENVLLSSSSSSPTGFVCKLGDFGLVRLLMGQPYIRNRSGSGTAAYQAPEVFLEGSRLTPAVDVYSFGIIMYELYCCRRPYSGQTKHTVANRVFRQQQRPHFPPGTWTKYQQLAEQCWATDPAARPTFRDIITVLQELLDAAGAPFTGWASFAAQHGDSATMSDTYNAA